MEDTVTKQDRYHAPKPVAVDDVMDVIIDAQGVHNDGIAKKDGFVIFVKGAAKGERCKVRLTEVKRTFAVGEKI